jgi:hypothetical protein
MLSAVDFLRGLLDLVNVVEGGARFNPLPLLSIEDMTIIHLLGSQTCLDYGFRCWLLPLPKCKDFGRSSPKLTQVLLLSRFFKC